MKYLVEGVEAPGPRRRCASCATSARARLPARPIGACARSGRPQVHQLGGQDVFDIYTKTTRRLPMDFYSECNSRQPAGCVAAPAAASPSSTDGGIAMIVDAFILLHSFSRSITPPRRACLRTTGHPAHRHRQLHLRTAEGPTGSQDWLPTAICARFPWIPSPASSQTWKTIMEDATQSVNSRSPASRCAGADLIKRIVGPQYSEW